MYDAMWQMGYGARALQALNSFYSGEYFNLDEEPRVESVYPDAAAIDPVCSFHAIPASVFTRGFP